MQVAETPDHRVRPIADMSEHATSPGFVIEARSASFPRHVSIVSCMLRSQAFSQTNAPDPVIPPRIALKQGVPLAARDRPCGADHARATGLPPWSDAAPERVAGAVRIAWTA
ncbi:hypothetical protein GCM10026982_20630 [Nocardiopsis aegyptia]